jgi:hypothetical protein
LRWAARPPGHFRCSKECGHRDGIAGPIIRILKPGALYRAAWATCGLRSRAFPGLLIFQFGDRGSRVYALTIDAPKVRRRMRRRVRSRILTSARTATRTFDLQLAIATPRLPAQLYVEIGTNPNDSGSVWRQQADPFCEEVRRRAAGLAHAVARIDPAPDSPQLPDSPAGFLESWRAISWLWQECRLESRRQGRIFVGCPSSDQLSWRGESRVWLGSRYSMARWRNGSSQSFITEPDAAKWIAEHSQANVLAARYRQGSS